MYSKDTPSFDEDMLFKVEKAAHSNLVIFLGAGVSMDMGLPSWRQLLEKVVIQERWKSDVPMASFLDSGNYGDYLTRLMEQNKLSEGNIQQAVADLITGESKSIAKDKASIYSKLAMFQSVHIVTTNYDNLCSKFLDVPVYTVDEFVGEMDSNDLFVKSWCLALHGTSTKPESIVLTPKSYEIAYQNKKFQDLIKNLNQSVKFLFLGFSFQDAHYVEETIRSFGSLHAKHYALCEDYDKRRKTMVEKELSMFSFQYYRTSKDKGYSHRDIVKQYLDEILSHNKELQLSPELQKRYEDALDDLSSTATLDRGMQKFEQLENDTVGMAISDRCSGNILYGKILSCYRDNDEKKLGGLSEQIFRCKAPRARMNCLTLSAKWYVAHGFFEKAEKFLHIAETEFPDETEVECLVWMYRYRKKEIGLFEEAKKLIVDNNDQFLFPTEPGRERSVLYEMLAESIANEPENARNAIKYLELADKEEADASIHIALGHEYHMLAVDPLVKKKSTYPDEMSLFKSRQYFDQALSECKDAGKESCLSRIAYEYLDVLKLQNWPLEYIGVYDTIIPYVQVKEQKHQCAYAEAHSLLSCGGKFDFSSPGFSNREKFFLRREEAYTKNKMKEYLRIVRPLVEGELCDDAEVQTAYLFDLFNEGNSKEEFEKRYQSALRKMLPFDRKLVDIIRDEMHGKNVEERLKNYAESRDDVGGWNELFAYYRRHKCPEKIIEGCNTILLLHPEFIEPSPASFSGMVFSTYLFDLKNVNAARDYYLQIREYLPPLQNESMFAELANRTFCIKEAQAHMEHLYEFFKPKISLENIREILVELAIISLDFQKADGLIAQARLDDCTFLMQSSLICSYLALFKNEKVPETQNEQVTERQVLEMISAPLLMKRLPIPNAYKSTQIGIDLATLTSYFSQGRQDELLNAKGIAISSYTSCTLFLLAKDTNQEITTKTLSRRMLKWIEAHKALISITNSPMDEYFWYMEKTKSKPIARKLFHCPGFPNPGDSFHPDVLHLMDELARGHSIILAPNPEDNIQHPWIVKLGKDKEFRFLCKEECYR